MSEHLSFSCVFAEKKERAEKDERWNESRVSCEPEPTNSKKQKQKKTFSPNATDREYIENRNVKNEMKMLSRSQKKRDAIELTYSELIVVGRVFAVSVLSQFSVQFASSSFWHHFSIIFISHFTFHSLRRMWMVIVSSCCLALIAYNILHDSLSSRLSGWIQVEVFHVVPTHRQRCSFFLPYTRSVCRVRRNIAHIRNKTKNLWNYSQCELLKEGLKGAWVGTNKWSYGEIWQRRTEKTRHVWDTKRKKITSQIENSR